MGAVADIEGAIVAQWSHLGRWPKGELHDENGLLWFETPIRHLPYNGVIRTRVPEGADAGAAIAAVVQRLRSRGTDFLWFGHPTATPADLGERLGSHGLRRVEDAIGMSLDLDGWSAPPPADSLAFEEVLDDAGMRAYHDLNVRYWEIPEGDERDLVAELNRSLGPGLVPGHRYLARLDGRVVAKAYLSLAGPPGVASIFGMSTTPESRGRGVATGLTAAMLERARAEGATRAVLMSSEMALGVYRRVGFAECCPVTVFATAPVWSDEG